MNLLQQLFDRNSFKLVYQLLIILQAEWEALEIVEHDWALANVEEELMEDFSPSDAFDAAKDKYV